MECMFMQFKVVDYIDDIDKDTVYLINNNWDDWFTYETVFNVYYCDSKEHINYIGAVKIGEENQSNRRPLLPNEFQKLENKFFSLGVNESYYEELKKYSFRQDYLQSLNDIAFDLELFDEALKYDVTKTSLMRDITASTVRGQFHRMAHGGARLTDYNFTYTYPASEQNYNENLKMSFDVKIETMPPTNIHVLIGKNGVGKTTILKRMLCALESEQSYNNPGTIDAPFCDFANIVYVSFSAFDLPVEFPNNGNDLPLPYAYVGLVHNNSIKGSQQLADDFCNSIYKIVTGVKNKLWKESIDILESDNTFMELNIKDWTSFSNFQNPFNPELFDSSSPVYKALVNYQLTPSKNDYEQQIKPQFLKLSSGHKVILLTIAKLIELVEEKTLVLLDEPEEHLHPPLVSAFIRALSNLLIYRNGVGIIATHSPVIVQEVPKKCVWILRRSGDCLKFERPRIETFGENLGELTSEIFGLEVTNSGFHKMLYDVAQKKHTYRSAIDTFHNELGYEARSILKSYMYEKEHFKEDQND